MIDRYGILNPADRRGIPHPTMLLIDRDGIVRWKAIETNYRNRPSNETVLKALNSLRPQKRPDDP